MRVLYTVQRYGEDVAGGSEAACRMFAEQLVERGHRVEVLTSCARRYTDWADEYPPGTTSINGVMVHRLPVVAERTAAEFNPLNDRTVRGPWPIPLSMQHHWLKAMGPQLSGYRRWLSVEAERFDVAIHMTYLYATTTVGLPVLAGRLPVLLQPTAHDEPAIWVRTFDTLFRLPDAFLFLTPEERDLVRRRFSFEPYGVVTGIGIDGPPSADPRHIRQRLGLGDEPYLLFLGRVEPAKGAVEAARFFAAYKQRNPGPLKLVLVGDPVIRLPAHPDVISAGYLGEVDKHAALAGALALLQPSYFESFSIVLCEAWLNERPALIQSACEVLRGQARRSGGAIPYHGFAEFEAAVDLLLERPDLATRLGKSGRRYVRAAYSWDRVIEQTEVAIELARARFGGRRGRSAYRIMQPARGTAQN